MQIGGGPGVVGAQFIEQSETFEVLQATAARWSDRPTSLAPTGLGASTGLGRSSIY